MEALVDRVDEIQEQLWDLPTNCGGFATIELWEPVAVTPDLPTALLAIAKRVYHSEEVTSVSIQNLADWHKAVREHVTAHASNDRSARVQALRLADTLINSLIDAMGAPRTVAYVTYEPSQWYAAVWEDWLLVTDSWAAVLHLGWDS